MIEKEVIYCCGCCSVAQYKFNDEEYCSECLIEAFEGSNDDKLTVYKLMD